MARRCAFGITLTLSVLFLSACAALVAPRHAALPTVSPSITPTQSAQVTDPPCPHPLPLNQAPTPTRLAADRKYTALGITLQVVETNVEPKISGRAAFDRLNLNSSQSGCDLKDELSYLSDSNMGCCIPPECMPGASPSAKACDMSVVKPLYQHMLSWVITWRSECGPFFGPIPAPGSTPRPPQPPMTCTSVGFVDATTGIAHETTSGSGATS